MRNHRIWADRDRTRLHTQINIPWIENEIETFQTRSEKLVLMTRLLLGIPEMSQL
jgi:hypothetical protein